MSHISKSKVVELFNACMDELYKASEPSISWVDLQKKYSGKNVSFYLDYHISEDKYNEIVDKYHKLIHKMYHNDLSWFLLDYAPVVDYKEGKI
jgi:hypothetical protein